MITDTRQGGWWYLRYQPYYVEENNIEFHNSVLLLLEYHLILYGEFDIFHDEFVLRFKNNPL